MVFYLLRTSGANASSPKYFSSSLSCATAMTAGKKREGRVGTVAAMPALTLDPPKSTTSTFLKTVGCAEVAGWTNRAWAAAEAAAADKTFGDTRVCFLATLFPRRVFLNNLQKEVTGHVMFCLEVGMTE